MEITRLNRIAWNKQVEFRNRWTIPVTTEMVEKARRGEWVIRLTPTPAPREWFPPLPGSDILCLASGGGQQGPILAAAGARVTVFDNSDAQLAQDRAVAEREHLDIRTVQGDMADLSAFPDSSFDLIVHPVSNSFVPSVLPVWREVYRVLRPGGLLLAGCGNGFIYLFDTDAYENGRLEVRHSLPYSDAESFSSEQQRHRAESGEPLEFGHTLDDQIGGQIAAGFVITGFREDKNDPYELLDHYVAGYIATRALKPL